MVPSGSPPPARPAFILCSALGGSARAAEQWNFYMHQSAPNFATSRGAKLLTEEIDKATAGEFKVRLHLRHVADQPGNITQAVGENVVQLGDDLFNSGNIPVAGIPRLPMLIQSYEDFAKADAVLKPYIEKAFGQKGSTVLSSYSYPMQVIWGRKKLESLDDIKGMAAGRAARAGRVRAPVRRHLDHHERARGSRRARSRRGRGHLHRRRRRRAVEGSSQIRLPARWSTSTTPTSSPTPTPTKLSRPAGQAAQGRRGHRALEPGHHEAEEAGRSRPCRRRLYADQGGRRTSSRRRCREALWDEWANARPDVVEAWPRSAPRSIADAEPGPGNDPHGAVAAPGERRLRALPEGPVEWTCKVASEVGARGDAGPGRRRHRHALALQFLVRSVGRGRRLHAGGDLLRQPVRLPRQWQLHEVEFVQARLTARGRSICS